MHGGPPAALLAGALDEAAGDDMQIARITFELLRPLAIGRLRLETSVTRPGRRVRGLVGTLSSNGVELVRASAVAIRKTSLELGDVPSDVLPPEPPEAFTPWTIPFARAAEGYHTAMECRMARGVFGSGAATVWFRMKVPLLDGTTPSGLERAVIAADSSNGVSVAIDVTRFTFLNPDLTLCLHRPPEGEWVALDAVTRPEPTGIGLASSTLFDRTGSVGQAIQTLIIEARS
jgi:hypothetical protein